MARVETEFEQSPSNREEGNGSKGIIAAGHTYRKLGALLAEAGNPAVQVLGISTLHPLPTKRVMSFLRKIDAALILEETAPYIESQVQALAQRTGLTLPIYGRSSKHLPAAGEIFAAEIGSALRRLLPDWPWPPFAASKRPMPSRQPLCEDCPYIPLMEALLGVMERHGGRDAFVVTGETGCMVRAQLAPWQILDVKYGMGSSIGLAAGMARAGIPQRLIALSGDSALIHSGLQQLIDAGLSGVDLLVIVLANQTTALSGGQPHPATDHDARGQTRESVDLVALLKAAGPADSGSGRVRVIDPEDTQETRAALEEGLLRSGVNIVVAERDCPR
jgi:indolepyruvate ferredoxin oxidoreductase alpha subunit